MLAEWQAYFSLEPFGPPAAFWRNGMLASVTANIHRGKNQQPYKPDDFMPQSLTYEEPRELDAADVAQMLRERFARSGQVRRGQ